MSTNPQKAHYSKIHEQYGAHYYDTTANSYRRRFLLGPLCRGLDLDDKKVADVACGSGMNSVILQSLYPKVELQGFDLSAEACHDYERNVGAPARECDLLEDLGVEATFDAVLIVGGLHHCIQDLDTALDNCVRMLKPGGHLLAVEPNAGYMLNAARTLWYRRSVWFEDDTEGPLHLDDLDRRMAPRMTRETARFFGGPAYFLILNSLVMRVPLRLKPLLQPVLFALESVYNLLPGRAPHAAFAARWRRR